MTRAGALLPLLAGLLLACGTDPPPAQDPGAALYGAYCALCHGEQGEGYAADNANALNNPDFLAVADDDFLRAALRQGRPGTPMSAWGSEWGGPLSDDDLDTLVAHIRNWETREPVDTLAITVEGEIDRGQDIYDVYCLDCHGVDGNGGDYMSLANPVFLATANDGFLRESIEHGRTQTPMGPYGNQLTFQQIDDLVVLIRSWQVDVSAPPEEFPSKVLDQPVLHPDGPDPAFPSEGRFISTEELAAAYEAGAAMVLADARPPSDYILGHITGAVSVPFFAVDDYLEQLPKDRWIVAYCACPHAESGVVADALEAAGFPNVRVLNEGYDDWVEKGHPVTGGIHP